MGKEKFYCEECGQVFDNLRDWIDLGTERHSYQNGYAEESKGIACPCCREENSYEGIYYASCSICGEDLSEEELDNLANINECTCGKCEDRKSQGKVLSDEALELLGYVRVKVGEDCDSVWREDEVEEDNGNVSWREIRLTKCGVIFHVKRVRSAYDGCTREDYSKISESLLEALYEMTKGLKRHIKQINLTGFALRTFDDYVASKLGNHSGEVNVGYIPEELKETK